MSDVTQTIPDSQNNLPRKFKDMGDGTFAEIVAANITQLPASLGAKTGALSLSVVPNTDTAFPVTSSNPAGLVVGQTKIVVTGTAVRLPSNALINGLIVKSKITNNVARQTVGTSAVTNIVDGTGNGYILEPGEAASFAVTNSNAIWVNGTAGDIFSFEGN